MIKIKLATSADIPQILAIAQVAWPLTYQNILSQAQMDYMMQMWYTPAVLQDTLQQGGHFLLALDAQDNALAFAAYEPYDAAKGIYKLQKLYALPQQQKQGLGKILIAEVKNNCKALGATQLILNVNRYNNACTFYLKMGFEVLERLDLQIGQGYEMNDYVMGIDL